MTTELEKQFFDTFGIEYCGCESPETQLRYKCGLSYPIKKQCYKITDRQYLELYCALCNAFNLLNINRIPAFAFKVKYFKECVLKDLIGIEEFYKNKHIKHQVQAIFEEER